MEIKKHQDRRITRTKLALHQALKDLVLEKGYPAVTVEDITTRANLGRTTFYLHYQAKEDILLEELDQHLSDLVDEIAKRPLVFWISEHDDDIIKSIFETVREKANIFSLISKEQSYKIYDRFRIIIGKVALKLINENPGAQKKIHQLTVPVDYLIDYFSGAMWASIVWWAGDNFTQTSDEMVQSFRVLFFPGLLRAFNVKKFDELVESLFV